MDNKAVSADLTEAHEVLTTPLRRADYDRAAWGETFTPDEAPTSHGADGTRLPSVPTSPASATGASRCPMGAEAQCPVLLGGAGPADTYCPDCGYGLAGLSAGGFDQAVVADADGYARLEEPDGRSHGLRVGLNTVGREGADVLLPDKTVSRQHARLEVGDDGTITVEDLSSTNGTQVGGDILVPHIPRTLQAGDRVRFGSVVTALHLPAGKSGATVEESLFAREAAPEPAAQDVPAAPETRVPARAQVVETREEGGRTYPLVPGATTFGRRAENSVIIQGDPYVSGSHAQILADGDVFRLTDIGSTNGTLLNGRRLAINVPETLSEGDVILIGGTAMRFEMLGVSEEADAEDVPSVKEAEIAPEDAAAEPRERTALEYDVPDDAADNGVPTRVAPTPDPPTQVER